MERDAGRMRYGGPPESHKVTSAYQKFVVFSDGGPTIFAVVKHDKGVDDIVNLILSAWKSCGAYDITLEKWKREGRKGSGRV